MLARRRLKRLVSAHQQARILAEAIPHLIRYDEQTVVMKFGGNAMVDEELFKAFAQDIVYLKQSGINPIVVHGGGPQIASMLQKLAIKSDFVNGLRVTDKPTVEIVEMVLAGKINKEIVSAINRQGGKAVGISGKDANLMIAKKITEMPDPQSNLMQAVDIGYVGDPLEVNPHIVEVISKSDLIPVIAPVGHQPRGRDAEYQRRHIRVGSRRTHAGQTAAVADRRLRRARQEQEAHLRACRSKKRAP